MSDSIDNSFVAPDAHVGDPLTEHNVNKVMSLTSESLHDPITGETENADSGYTIEDSDNDGLSDVGSIRSDSWTADTWPKYNNPLCGLTNEEWPIKMKDGSTKNSGVFTKISYNPIEPGTLLLTNNRMPDPITGKYSSEISKTQILPPTLLDPENGKRRCLLSGKSTLEGSKYMLLKISELPEPTNVYNQANFSIRDQEEGADEGKRKENEADTKKRVPRTELFENKNPEYSCFVAGYLQQSFAETLEFERDTVEKGKEGNTDPSQGVSDIGEFPEDEEDGIDYFKSHFVGVFDPLLKCRCSGDTHDSGSRYSNVNGNRKCPRTIYSGIEPDHIKAIYRSLKDSNPYIARPTDLIYAMTKAAWSVGKKIAYLQQTDPLTADENLRRYTDEHGEYGNNKLLFGKSSVDTAETPSGYGNDKDDISNKVFEFDTSNPSVPKCSIMFSNKKDWEDRKQEVEENIEIYQMTQHDLMSKKRDKSIRLDLVPMPIQDPKTSCWGSTTTQQAVKDIGWLRRSLNQDRAMLGLGGLENTLQDWASRKWTNDPTPHVPIEPEPEFDEAKVLEWP